MCANFYNQIEREREVEPEMAGKRSIRFTLRTQPELTFQVGHVHRFNWNDLYYVLTVLQKEVESNELRLEVESLLGSTQEVVQSNLFLLLSAIETDGGVVKDKVLACGWVIACYGYLHGLNVPSPEDKWPHPSPLKRRKRIVVLDWRDELYCSVCGRRFRTPKSVKAKDLVLRRFGVWLQRHMLEPH